MSMITKNYARELDHSNVTGFELATVDGDCQSPTLQSCYREAEEEQVGRNVAHKNSI